MSQANSSNNANPFCLNHKHRGFTLIEILVALALFSIMSVIAYRGVDSMLRVRHTLDADSKKWRSLTTVLARLDEDFAQVASRPWRDTGGVTRAPLQGSDGVIDFNGAQLELIRFDEGHLTHVGYRLSQGRLELLLWDVIDLAPRSAPVAYVLLDKVSRFTLRYLDKNGQWQLSWLPSPNTKPPKGVEVTLGLESGETFTRLYYLP